MKVRNNDGREAKKVFSLNIMTEDDFNGFAVIIALRISIRFVMGGWDENILFQFYNKAYSSAVAGLVEKGVLLCSESHHIRTQKMRYKKKSRTT